MITACPVCGKSVVAHWPEFWPYRRGEAYYCTQNCYDISLTRDLNTLHDAARRRRQSKMARMRKDGTPAKRPGRKPQQIETPEGEFTPAKPEIPEQVPTVKVNGPLKIETPEAGNIEIVRKSKRVEYKVTGISTSIGDFQHFKKAGYLDWTTLDGTTVSMNLAEWNEFMKVFPAALMVLGVKL